MPEFKVPLRDIHFLINEVLDYPGHYQKLANGGDATPDMVEAILQGAAQICENVIAPLDQPGDEEGCHFDNGEVRTPKGFKEAYQQFVEGGWQGLSFPEEYGGQGLPISISLLKTEMVGTACWSFNMYPGLSIGCINTLLEFGNELQKKHYLPHLVSGEWSGTMCLTEPQCGTDLAQVKTKAAPQDDGSYKINGTKIFISAGEHDLTDNIIHIVLARLPDAPEGTRGISLFLVPKVLLDEEGKLGERNAVNCGSIEHKMGIRASATAVLNFDDATGYMVGEPNRGLEAMFTFMNTARIGTAIQGVCHAERAYQGSLPYARERRSMRALSGPKEPDQPADALIWHADVRRMLLTQKAIAEGGRAMIYSASMLADFVFNAAITGDTEGEREYDDKLGFYTPILKGFLTELGVEAANEGMQVFGGHGYIREWGMEQIARDARIATMYEGTTGVQALDLLGRKVLLQTRGRCVRDYSKDLFAFSKRNFFADSTVGSIARTLGRRASQWNWLTTRIMLRAKDDREAVGAASFDFLMYSGYIIMGYYWGLQAEVAAQKLRSGDGSESEEFYRGKLQTAEFYFERLLPRADAHKRCALASTASVQQMENDTFSAR